MSKAIYKPVDSEYYQLDEYLFDIRTGNTKPTGRRFRFVDSHNPNDVEQYTIFLEKARRKGWLIINNPNTAIPGAYELIE